MMCAFVALVAAAAVLLALSKTLQAARLRGELDVWVKQENQRRDMWLRRIDDAHIKFMEARQLRDKWKFAKMNSDAVSSPNDEFAIPPIPMQEGKE